MSDDQRPLSGESLRWALDELATICATADRLKLNIEDLDPVDIHRELTDISRIAAWVALVNLQATSEKWQSAMKHHD